MKTVGARLEFLEASYRAHIINMTELERPGVGSFLFRFRSHFWTFFGFVLLKTILDRD